MAQRKPDGSREVTVVILDDVIYWRRLEKVMREHLAMKLAEAGSGQFYLISCRNPEAFHDALAGFGRAVPCRTLADVDKLIAARPAFLIHADYLRSILAPVETPVSGKPAASVSARP